MGVASMREWLEGIAGPAYATAMLWTLAALLGLLSLGRGGLVLDIGLAAQLLAGHQ